MTLDGDNSDEVGIKVDKSNRTMQCVHRSETVFASPAVVVLVGNFFGQQINDCPTLCIWRSRDMLSLSKVREEDRSEYCLDKNSGR